MSENILHRQNPVYLLQALSCIALSFCRSVNFYPDYVNLNVCNSVNIHFFTNLLSLIIVVQSLSALPVSEEEFTGENVLIIPLQIIDGNLFLSQVAFKIGRGRNLICMGLLFIKGLTLIFN